MDLKIALERPHANILEAFRESSGPIVAELKDSIKQALQEPSLQKFEQFKQLQSYIQN